MKKIYIIIGIVTVLLATLFFLMVLKARSPEQQIKQDPITFPTVTSTSSGSTATNLVAFLDAPDVKQDQTNPGYYYLGNQPSTNTQANPAYLIEYIKETNYFGITLLQEPIGQYRLIAERYLQSKLNLTNEQMCSLDYVVGVPDNINPQYSSINLGFSFCPGAVKLPQ